MKYYDAEAAKYFMHAQSLLALPQVGEVNTILCCMVVRSSWTLCIGCLHGVRPVIDPRWNGPPQLRSGCCFWYILLSSFLKTTAAKLACCYKAMSQRLRKSTSNSRSEWSVVFSRDYCGEMRAWSSVWLCISDPKMMSKAENNTSAEFSLQRTCV